MLALFVALYAAFAGAYAFHNPPFESPDEPGHVAFANRLAAERALPNQLDPREWTAQGHHHPLYYVLAAGAMVAMGGPVDFTLSPNPDGRPDRARFDHARPIFPIERDRSVFLLLRLLGVAFGGATVLAVGLAARRFTGEAWWVAPGVVALLPQFQFIGAAVSNDAPAAFTAALAIGAGLGALRAGRGVWLGVALALAAWTKKSCLALWPALLLVIPWRDREVRARFLAGGALALALFSPWIVRNSSLYGEPLGNAMEATTMPELVEPKPFFSRLLLVDIPVTTARSFVAHLGWMNVATSRVPIAGVLGTLAVLALASLWSRSRRDVAMLWACVALMIAGLLFYNLTFTQPQGRLLFPALGAIGLLCALGADVLRERVSARVWRGLAALTLSSWLATCAWTFVLNARFYDR